jgi:hypothetical protein
MPWLLAEAAVVPPTDTRTAAAMNDSIITDQRRTVGISLSLRFERCPPH